MTKEQQMIKVDFVLCRSSSNKTKQFISSLKEQLTYKDTLSDKQLHCLENQYRRWINGIAKTDWEAADAFTPPWVTQNHGPPA